MQCKSILIVDDSVTSRLIIKRCFEMAGYSEAVYHEAANGAEAVSFCEENDVDLILSDIKMPKMDGLTFVKKIGINKRNADTPIVIISSVAENAGKDPAIGGRIKALIQKPLSPAKVAKALGGL